MAHSSKMAAYQRAYQEIAGSPVSLCIEEILRNNCFASGTVYFVNICMSVNMIVEALMRGGTVSGVFEKVSKKYEGAVSAKTIERSIRSAIYGAWNRAIKNNVLEATSVFGSYPVRPKSTSFLRDVAAIVAAKLKAAEKAEA